MILHKDILLKNKYFIFFPCHYYFSVGGSIPVIFSYFTEFQPKDRRGMMISALATFWMCGNIIAAGKSVIICLRSFIFRGCIVKFS